MSDAQLVRPDLGYVNELMAAGGESLKKCYQCATCSVVCGVTPDARPFPRKEMIWAQWGLREKLVSNPDLWLCHGCSDCTAYCPREAKPGEVMAAVRRTGYRHYAVPRFMGTLFSDLKYLPLLFAFPVAVLLAMLAGIGTLRVPPGEVVFSKMLPVTNVDLIFVPFALLALVFAVLGLRKFWRGLESQVDPALPRRGFFPSLLEFLKELGTHQSFRKCVTASRRSTAHLLVIYGFAGLFVVTNIVLVFHYLLDIHSPIPLAHPVKWLANLSGLALLAGAILIINNRFKEPANIPAGPYDWVFMVVIFLLALSGMLAQFLRVAGWGALAYPTYFVHLVFAFYVIVYVPYSKLAHLLYRSAAIIHAKSVHREQPAAEAPAEAR